MALKLNIRPEIEEQMNLLLPRAGVRSKTDYINRAIEAYNRFLSRKEEIAKLAKYFDAYRGDAQEILDDFASIRTL